MSDLELILRRDTDGKMKLWACRGVGKGCSRNKHRKTKTTCTDCMGPLPQHLTLEQAQARLKQGDA